MKRSHENFEETLKRLMTRRNPADARMDAGIDKAWQQLNSESIGPVPNASRVHAVRSPRVFLKIGLATAMMIAVMFGVVRWRGRAPEVPFGETIRSNANRVLTLKDGSAVEMRAASELRLEPANDGIRIRLIVGSVIVNAAKQEPGRHLYVQTKDVSVSVVGTVFLVGTEKSGSHVAVIEGEVRVEQDGVETKLLPGQQLTVTTNPAMPSPPVAEEVGWSGEAETHVAMLQQAAAPQLRPQTTPKWEVTSIRQCTGDQPGNARGGGNGGTASAGAMGTSPGLLRVTCMPLKWLIERAYVKYLEYDMKPTWFFPITGGPEWIKTDLYTIMAKTEGLPSEQEMRGPMLQALLEERFNLKMKREIRQEPVYELRIADGGLKMQPLKEEECEAREAKAPEGETQAERLDRMLKALQRRPAPCGSQMIGGPQDGTKAPPRTRTVNVFGGPLDLLTRNLSLDRIIIDTTGLGDRLFDMQLTYSIDKSPMREPQPVSATEPPAGDSIFVAIEKQLGLKLVPLVGPRTYYTIEHVDRPTPN